MKYGLKDQEKERFRGGWVKRRNREFKAIRQNFDKTVFAGISRLI
jgi:hypothetical protein